MTDVETCECCGYEVLDTMHHVHCWDAYLAGLRAGLQRAATICEGLGESVCGCAEAIRAEVGEG